METLDGLALAVWWESSRSMCRIWMWFGMLGMAAGMSGQTAERAWVSGTVVDASGAGIGQAEVVLERGGLLAAETKAGASGRFELPVAGGAGAEEKCVLRVTAPGFEANETPVACEVVGRLMTVQMEGGSARGAGGGGGRCGGSGGGAE